MSKQYDMFDRPKTYPESPGFKERTTSREAADAMADSAPTLRRKAYRTLMAAGYAGLTPDEVAAQLGETVLAIRPRVTELSKMGYIVETGERRKNISGLNAKVWRVIGNGTLRPG